MGLGNQGSIFVMALGLPYHGPQATCPSSCVIWRWDSNYFLLCLLTFSQLWFIFLVGTSLGIWQKLTKKTMGGISRRFILILGKNNFFEVAIIKRVFFETILLHINNYTLQICLVYDECINYGYYLMRFILKF